MKKRTIKKTAPKKATSKKTIKKVCKCPKKTEIVFVKSGRDRNGEQLYSAVPVYSDVPEGWRKIAGATNHPKGYAWICNNKSLFAKDKKGKPLFKQAFVKTNKEINKK